MNRIDGIDDAIISMFISKRTLTRELEMRIRTAVDGATACFSDYCYTKGELLEGEMTDQIKDWLEKLFKWGRRHMTMLRFIDLSFTVYGLHRGAQDDFDAHSMRMNNRIIRSSTRLARFNNNGQIEMSEFYQDKIIPTDMALAFLGIEIPEKINYHGEEYVRTGNGYILKDMENNNDVKRGLYLMSIPSNFIFRCQLTEFAHIYKERNSNSGANPELKSAVEEMADQIDKATLGYVNRKLLLEIPN